MPTGVGDCVLLSLLLSYVDLLLAYVLTHVHSSLFYIISVSLHWLYAIAGQSVARVSSSSLEIPTHPPTFQSFSHTLWTDFECVFASTFDCILAACGSKMGVLIGWQSAPCGGLDRQGSWMMIDFNASV